MIENLNGIHETVNFKENMNIRLYDNDESEDYPAHWHTPLEIVMPTESDYRIDCGTHTFHLRERDILIICPGVIHSLYSPTNGRRIIFQSDMSVLYKIRELETILSLITPAIIITPEKCPDIHSRLCELLLFIKEEYFDNVPLSEASIYARLIDMFVLLGRNHTESTQRFDVGNSKHTEYTEKFLYICNYISEHCTEDLSLDEVAHLAGFSKYHFTRLFKQFANISFYKYLNQKRIAHSETLLIEPDISITEVALHSGFTSLSAFIRMFKIIKACTPTEFRKMYIGTQS